VAESAYDEHVNIDDHVHVDEHLDDDGQANDNYYDGQANHDDGPADDHDGVPARVRVWRQEQLPHRPANDASTAADEYLREPSGRTRPDPFHALDPSDSHRGRRFDRVRCATIPTQITTH
jgi:hypothetical protein